MKFRDFRTRGRFGSNMPALLSAMALAVASLSHSLPAWAQAPLIIGGGGEPNVQINLGVLEGEGERPQFLPLPPPVRRLQVPGSPYRPGQVIVLTPPRKMGKGRARTILRPPKARALRLRPPGPRRAVTKLGKPKRAAAPPPTIGSPPPKPVLRSKAAPKKAPAKRLARKKPPAAVKAPPPPPIKAPPPPAMKAPPPVKKAPPKRMAKKKPPPAKKVAKAPPPKPPAAKATPPPAKKVAKAPPPAPKRPLVKAPALKPPPAKKVAKAPPSKPPAAKATPPPPPAPVIAALPKSPPPRPAPVKPKPPTPAKAPPAPAKTLPATPGTRDPVKSAPLGQTPAPAPAKQTAALPKVPKGVVTRSTLRLAFSGGSSRLSSAVETDLKALAKTLNANADLRLQLKAYAAGTKDTVSRARRLSLSRALSVRSYLIKQGVRSTRIDVRALGNKTGGGPADRVDIFVVNR